MVFARGLIGAAVGTIAGVGFALCWNALPPNDCPPYGRGGMCFNSRLMWLPVLLLIWALVAGALLAWALRLTEPEPVWSAPAGLGCLLWPFVGLGGGMLGLLVGSDVAKVLVPVVAYTLAAALTTPVDLRPSRSAHGDEPPTTP